MRQHSPLGRRSTRDRAIISNNPCAIGGPEPLTLNTKPPILNPKPFLLDLYGSMLAGGGGALKNKNLNRSEPQTLNLKDPNDSRGSGTHN